MKNTIKKYVIKYLRILNKTDVKILKDYLLENKKIKLHIGCGGNTIEGWLNTDFMPSSRQVLNLDATKVFPFKDNQFDYIFSEHMIEHIPYKDGKNMLTECFRVLKPGGKLRLSTPDLKFLIGLYQKDKSALQNEFLKDSTKSWLPDAPYISSTFVINNYVRAWGHQFIYDEEVLSSLLHDIGFLNIIRKQVCDSQDKNLINLENISRKPDGLINLESLILEATNL